MRKNYDEIKVQLICFERQDVVTLSLSPNPEDNETEPDFLG